MESTVYSIVHSTIFHIFATKGIYHNIYNDFTVRPFNGSRQFSIDRGKKDLASMYICSPGTVHWSAALLSGSDCGCDHCIYST